MNGEEENILPKLDFGKMLDSEFWKLRFYQPDDFLWQQTSFQPVGGMDMIVRALAIEVQKLGGTILLNAPAVKIDRRGTKYTVTYRSGKGNKRIKADKVYSNMPIPLLKGKVSSRTFQRADFWKALAKVMNDSDFLQPTVKVGWQSERKFWQDPEDKNIVPIFGGISWTSAEMTQMWYPSNDYNQNLGVLTGAYNFGGTAKKWGDHDPKWRLKQARQGAEELHGSEFAKQLDHGLTIAWQNIKTQRGGWVDWAKIDDDTRHPELSYKDILNIRRAKAASFLRTATVEPEKHTAAWCYNELQKGDDGFYIVGDQLSSLPGWQEGAISSALVAVGLSTKMRGFSVSPLLQVPFTEQLVEGRRLS